MIPGIGTLINGFGVIVSGILARIIFKKELKNFDENLLPLGLLVLALGFRETLKSPDFIFTLFAVIVGSIIGSYLKIEDRVKNFGDYLYLKFEKGESDQTKFIESYLTTTLIVITGPLAIIGPFFDVVESNLELLLIKSFPIWLKLLHIFIRYLNQKKSKFDQKYNICSKTKFV